MTESNFKAELSIFELSGIVPQGRFARRPRKRQGLQDDDSHNKKREKGHDAHFRAAEHGCG
jgi:hypothetical protein